MAGKKKLKQANINRNTSIEVSHTIKKIKENERKYTIILVIFFMIIIGIVGYNVLTIDNDELYSNIKTASANSPYLSLSSTNITLTNKNIMSEKNGLKSKKYAISIITLTLGTTIIIYLIGNLNHVDMGVPVINALLSLVNK